MDTAKAPGESWEPLWRRALGTGMKRYQTRLYGPLVALWITLSVAGVLMAWITWKQLATQVDLAVQRAEFNDALDGVFATVVDAETGQRGYIITGLPQYLEPYQGARTNFTERFNRLADLALADKELRQQVLDLRAVLEVRLSLLEKGIQARREGDTKGASDVVGNGEGKAAMDQIRDKVRTMRLARPNLLTSEGDLTRDKLWRANFTSLAAGLVGVGTGVFAFFLTRVAFNQEKKARAMAEEKLKAEQSSEHKSAFLANMSHEIRTPMNAILGFSDLLDGELKDPKQRQWLRSIRTSGQSLLQLINDVLDMSKIESGAMELHPEPTDPREICDFLRTVFTEQATRKGVKLSCDVPQDLPRALLLDRTRLRQVLVNLVGNAVKFTDRGYIRIIVRWEAQQDSTSRVVLTIEVEDTGVGIPENRLEEIFKPFAQADLVRAKDRQGTGLGLAIVKRLVERMGGQVGVASVVGKGTTFHLRIPDVGVSARLPANQQMEADEEADFDTLRPSTVLVVDDNELNRQLMAGIFDPTHHTVHYGASGQDAVDLTLKLRPDIVLLDIRMPGMDGREAFDRIRATPGFDLVPIVAVTASSMADEEKRLRQKFSGYLRKPFTRRALLDEMANFIPRLAPRRAPASEPLEPATPADTKAALAALAVKLHALEAGEWPHLRDSVAVNETRRFARQLRALGEEASCQALVAHAAALLRHAEAYDISSLETELGRFPQVIAEIERLSV